MNPTNDQFSILIAEDSLLNLKLLGSVLKNKYKLALARNGQEALDILLKFTPDLIILDVMMPDLDGFETCKQIKQMEAFKDIPIIFLTAKNDEEDIVNGFEMGGVDYIIKPFKKEELLVRVQTHLDLKKSKEDLVLMAKELKDLNSVKDRLFSIIAHDLRSPLANIKMAFDFFKSMNLFENRELFNNAVSELSFSTNETLEMLDNLLAWARNQGKEIRYAPCFFNLQKMVRELVTFVNINATVKGIYINNCISTEYIVWGDENLLKIIIRNLLTNAIKFTKKNGTITLDLCIKGDVFQLDVKDTGVGMSELQLTKLFKTSEYFTTHGTNNEKGSGLGLLLCRDFIEMHGGEISAKSQLGEGTTISITLPHNVNTEFESNS